MDVTSSNHPIVVGSSGYNEFTENGSIQHHQGFPFRWNLTTPLQQLAAPSIDRPGGQAWATSADGDFIVGYTYYRQGPQGELGYLPAVWSQQTGWSHQQLPPASGFVFARAVGYSDRRGLIVGYSMNSSSSSTAVRRGTVWNGPGGTGMVLSENLPGAVATTTWPNAISDNGKTIVGSLHVDVGSSVYRRPCVWRGNPSNFEIRELPLLPGCNAGMALDVSRNGNHIVGSCLNANDEYVPCKWRRNGQQYTVEAITNLPFAGTGTAVAISRSGNVIVGYTSVGDDYVQQPWIWSSANGARSLVQAFQSDGITGHVGWQRLQPEELSDDGRNIVGFGQNPQDQTEGWLARLNNP